MNNLVNILLYIWQLPQHLLGLLLLCYYKPEHTYEYNGVLLCYTTRMGSKGYTYGLALGRYAFIDDRPGISSDGWTEAHEYGHCRQSRYLGPVYLLAIGLPSLLWAAWWNADRDIDYYAFFTEKWADKLGGVRR